jgi:hypothetical protein
MTPLDSRTAEARYVSFRQAIRIFIAVAGGVVTAVALGGRVQELIKSYSTNQVTSTQVLGLVLFVLVLLLGIAWYSSAEREIEPLRPYVTYTPPRPVLLLWIAILSATTLVLLMYSSDRVLLFAAIYVPYSAVALVARLITRREAAAVQKLAGDDPAISKRYAATVKAYYVDRPHGTTGLISCALGVLALLIALTFSTSTGSAKVVGNSVAYAAIIASIVVSEAFVWTWRAKVYGARDKMDAEQRAGPISSADSDAA